MSLTVSTVALTCAICYGIYKIAMWHVGRRHHYKLASKFDGPPVLPFIGNAHQVAGSSEYLLSKLNELSNVHSSPFRIWLGPRLLLFFTDPEQAQEICTSPKTLGKGSMADFAQPLVGTGLFTAPVSKWKVHRRLIQPTFNTKILDSFVEVFSSQSRLFTSQIAGNVDGPEFEIFTLSLLCTLDIICESAMGEYLLRTLLTSFGEMLH